MSRGDESLLTRLLDWYNNCLFKWAEVGGSSSSVCEGAIGVAPGSALDASRDQADVALRIVEEILTIRDVPFT